MGGRATLGAFHSLPDRRDSWLRRAVKAGKRWLFYTHRWLGVATCLLSVMWFVSGLVMLYVQFPAWTDRDRITFLPPIDLAHVKVLPDAALAASGLSGLPSVFRLEMDGDEPVYRIIAGGKPVTVSGVTGSVVAGISERDARRRIAAIVGHDINEAAEVDGDQWTVTRRFNPYRPLYKFDLGDDAGTVLYVSSKSGEVVQDTTRVERFWNWLGAIPHWIYFTPIRKDQEVWRQSVMWLSGPLIIGASAGLWVGLLRLRPSRMKAGKSITPHRGWMKWHHIGGLIGGLFLAGWIFSGWLSVNPFGLFARTQLTEGQRAAYAGAPSPLRLGVTRRALGDAKLAGAKEISFYWVAGRPLMLARSERSAALYSADSGKPTGLSTRVLREAAQTIMPAASIVAADVLTREHVYWYSHHRKRPLPILEVVFDDPNGTWLYIDPATGELAGLIDRSARANRWLYKFLHDYDLPVLLRNQPARDGLVWLLSIAGLIISISGVVVGWRTLKRGKFP